MKPNAVVAGLGFMGYTHIQTLRRLGISVAGVVGINAGEGQKAANEFDIPKWYQDFDEVVNDPEINVIHLCTPNHLHFSQAKKALESGKHVLCEKPLAMTSDEGREIAEIASHSGLIAAVNYNLRFYPICQEARQRIHAGELGEPYLIQGGYLQDWLFKKSDWNWRLDPEKGGELRVVADIGTHWMDLVSHLTGLKITEVMADFSTVHKTRLKPNHEIETFSGKINENMSATEMPIYTEDVALILFHFENGAQGNVTLSQVSAGRKNFLWFEISGSKSTFSWNQENPNELWIGHRDSENQILLKDPALFHGDVRRLTGFPGGHAEGYPDTFFQTFKQFYSAVASGIIPKDACFATFEDGYREMQLCKAIQQSAVEKRWVGVGK